MKKCTHCGKEKDDSEFYNDTRRKDGLSSWCMECTRDAAKRRKSGIADCTPRELMQELAKRGYYGTVCYDTKKEREVEIDGQKGIFSYTETVKIDITNF